MIKKILLWATTFLFSLFLVACSTQKHIEKSANIYYEIFVGAFYDSNADGMGDLKGVEDKLSYLDELGITGIWLMPIMPSPTYHKYDVTDYYQIDPDYGTLDDFKSLISSAQDKNIDIIIDLVLNHSSVEHPWFIEGLNDYKNGITEDTSKRYYYHFQETPQTGYEKVTGESIYYEARFWSGMPDLNLDNPYLKEELFEIASYWLDLGVKGFRLDAVTYFYTGYDNQNIAFLKSFQEHVKAVNSDAYIVAEAWTNQSRVASYYESGIDSFFNFDASNATGQINVNILAKKGETLANYLYDYHERIRQYNPNAIDALFLTNHDQNRSAHYMSSLERKKLAASIYLLQPGIPFIYYGEEIGLLGRGIDENKRLPMIWSQSDKNGQTNPVINHDFDISVQVTEGAYDLLQEKNSLTVHYQSIIQLRHQYSQFITHNHANILSIDERLYAVEYQYNGKSIVIIHNFSDEIVSAEIINYKLSNSINVSQEVASYQKNTLKIGGYSTVILTK